MLRTPTATSNMPETTPAQRQQQLAALSRLLRAMGEPVPPMSPREAYAAVAAAATFMGVVLLMSCAVNPLLRLIMSASVDGFVVALAAAAAAAVVVMRRPDLPRSWRQDQERKLASLLCAYVPADVEAYRGMQRQLEAAGELCPQILTRWIDHETAALSPAGDKAGWRAVVDRRL